MLDFSVMDIFNSNSCNNVKFLYVSRKSMDMDIHGFAIKLQMLKVVCHVDLLKKCNSNKNLCLENWKDTCLW